MAKGKVYDTVVSRPHKQGKLDGGAAASSGERSNSKACVTPTLKQVGTPKDKGVNR